MYRRASRPYKRLLLIERALYKRQWRDTDQNKVETDWRAEVDSADLGQFLTDRLEVHLKTEFSPKTLRQLARVLHRDPKVLAVAEVYAGRPEPDLEHLFTDLVRKEAVPFLAVYRYKKKGLEKHRLWQRTWAAQRQEDAGEAVVVPLPPKFGSEDFARSEYWRLRGKLDVPKERFISYPGAGDEDDPSPLLGWAGWDHADRVAALGALVEQESEPERLKPLLAGMLELLPWVEQWHSEDMRYGTPLGEMWRGHLQGLLHTHGLTEEELRAWRPPKTSRSLRKGDNR